MEQTRHAYVLVSDEKYWKRLCNRNKTAKTTHAFVRKNQVAPKQANQLLFYVKKPSMQVRGYADFVERSVGNHQIQWEKYGKETCFENFEEYAKFIQDREKVTIVRFKNLVELPAPLPTEVAVSLLGSMQWFRGKYVNKETAKQLTT